MPRTPWKPPVWMLVFDGVATLLVGFGLHLQFAPDSPISTAVPAALKLPLLVAGGMMLLVGTGLIVRSVLAHLNH